MVDMQRRCRFIEVADCPAPRDDEPKKYLGKTRRFESATPHSKRGVVPVDLGQRRAPVDLAILHAIQEVYPGITTHGMRSSFRDWAGDETDHPHATSWKWPWRTRWATKWSGLN